MIAALLLIQAAVPAAGAPTLEALPKQVLPDRGCAAYLWSVADRRLIAMASADPARLRLAVDGKVVDADRTGGEGAGDYGFAASATYATGELGATLAMTVVRRPDLTAGAAVPTGTLTIARAGGDSVVVPVAGLIGCAG